MMYFGNFVVLVPYISIEFIITYLTWTADDFYR